VPPPESVKEPDSDRIPLKPEGSVGDLRLRKRFSSAVPGALLQPPCWLAWIGRSPSNRRMFFRPRPRQIHMDSPPCPRRVATRVPQSMLTSRASLLQIARDLPANRSRGHRPSRVVVAINPPRSAFILGRTRWSLRLIRVPPGAEQLTHDVRSIVTHRGLVHQAGTLGGSSGDTAFARPPPVHTSPLSSRSQFASALLMMVCCRMVCCGSRVLGMVVTADSR